MRNGITILLLAAAVVLTGAATASAAITGQWPISTAAWNAGNGTQGQYGDWYFKRAWYDQWDNSHWWGEYHDASWSATNGYWTGYDPAWDHIARTQVQIYDNVNALLIAWKAPASGTFNLNVSVDYYSANWAQSLKSVGLSIQQQSGNVFTMVDDLTYYQTSFSNQTTSLYNGPVTVSAGDWLYFRTEVKSNETRSQPILASWNIAIPEPASLALLLLGAGSLTFRRRR